MSQHHTTRRPTSGSRTTFVFDADGVLCPGPYFTVALEREHGIPRERLIDFFHGPMLACIRGERDLMTALRPLLPAWGWRGSVEAFLQFWFTREHLICPTVLACVRQLKARGHRCVLGTNQEKYRAAYLREEMKLAAEFDDVIPACEVGAAKPAPAFFVAVERRVGEPAHGFCLIDDSLPNVLGARAAHWRAIWFRNQADLSQIEAETTFEREIAAGAHSLR